MRVYCAGPLFTPYERDFMSQCGKHLREHGIEAFVPHESPRPELPPQVLDLLRARNLIAKDDLISRPLRELVSELTKSGRLDPKDLEPILGTSAKRCYDNDFGAIAASNAMLAVVNGPEVDDGTACEIGIFYGLKQSDAGKLGIVALQQDWRTEDPPHEGKGLNAFVLGCVLEVGQVCHSLEEATRHLLAWQAQLEQGGGNK